MVSVLILRAKYTITVKTDSLSFRFNMMSYFCELGELITKHVPVAQSFSRDVRNSNTSSAFITACDLLRIL